MAAAACSSQSTTLELDPLDRCTARPWPANGVVYVEQSCVYNPDGTVRARVDGPRYVVKWDALHGYDVDDYCVARSEEDVSGAMRNEEIKCEEYKRQREVQKLLDDMPRVAGVQWNNDDQRLAATDLQHLRKRIDNCMDLARVELDEYRYIQAHSTMQQAMVHLLNSRTIHESMRRRNDEKINAASAPMSNEPELDELTYAQWLQRNPEPQKHPVYKTPQKYPLVRVGWAHWESERLRMLQRCLHYDDDGADEPIAKRQC